MNATDTSPVPVASHFVKLYFFGCLRSSGFFLECVPPGIEKSNSLDRLVTSLGLDRSEVIAVGDGYNDIGLIRYAGLGVAMANASREVQDEADYITWSNQEDGVAHVVGKFILI